MLYRGKAALSCLLLYIFLPTLSLQARDEGTGGVDAADSLFQHIQFLVFSNQNDSAHAELTRIIERSSELDEVFLRAKNELADNYRWIYETDLALSILDEVVELYEQNPKIDSTEFIRNQLYRGKLIRDVDSDTLALTYVEESLRLAGLHLEGYSELKGDIYREYAYLYADANLDDFEKSQANNELALDMYLSVLDPWHFKLGLLYYLLGGNNRDAMDFELAMNYYRLSELIFKRYDGQFIGRVLNARVAYGNSDFDDRNYKMAIKHYLPAIRASEETGSVNSDRMVKAYVNIGASYLEIGKLDSAEYYLRKSYYINPVSDKEDSLMLAYQNQHFSQVMHAKNKKTKAKKLVNTSLDIYKKYTEESRDDMAMCFALLGYMHEVNDDFAEALSNYQQALRLYDDRFNYLDTYSNPLSFDSVSISNRFILILGKARLFKLKYDNGSDLQDLTAAIELYRIAHQQIRKLANSNYLERSLLEIPEKYGNELELSIQCAIQLYELTGDLNYYEDLLSFVENSKYFLLQGSVLKSSQRDVLGIPDSIYQKEKKLTEAINVLKVDLNDGAYLNEEEEFELRYRLTKAMLELDELRQQGEGLADSNYKFLELANSISLQSVRENILKKDEVLIEYFRVSDTLYAAVITEVGQSVLRLPLTDEFDLHVENYLSVLLGLYQDTTKAKTEFKFYAESSFALYQQLIEPVLAYTEKEGISHVNRLFIISDGILSLVPFEALIQKPATEADREIYGNLSYLFESFTINYGYSLNILENNFVVDNTSNRNGILGMSYSSSIESRNESSRDNGLDELPYSAIELRNLEKRAKGRYFDGNNATEYVFKDQAKKYSVIHLALHGEGDTLDMLKSRIVFKEPGNELEDGFLYAHELYGIDLGHTQLAVLSACETGTGKNLRGEGVYSLARGFAYAGCPSIVMSLWRVSDRSTAMIMEYFYEFLLEDYPVDEALREAKLKYISLVDDQNTSPAFWAAFIAIGNNSPVEIPERSFFWYYILASVLIVSIVLLYLRRRSTS